MDVKKLKIYTDGGAENNPGPAAFGVVFQDEKGNTIFEHSESIGKATNNVAEYKGILYGLRNAKRYHPEEITLYSDSKLIIRQLQGKYKIENKKLQPLFLKCWNRILDFENLKLQHIPSEQNKEADQLVKKELSQDSLDI